MTIFVVRIGNNEVYKKCSELLVNYFKKHNLKYFFLEEKLCDAHPSWYKLKAHDIINDDFILSWDLDLLPKNNADNILNYLNLEKINLAIDTAVKLKNINSLNEQKFFKFNCGLMGIPKTYIEFCKTVFNENSCKTPFFNVINPSPTEQYLVNYELAKSGFKDVHEIDSRWNTLAYFDKENLKNILNAKAVHYTSYFFNGHKEKNIFLNKHYNQYFNLEKKCSFNV